MTWCILSTISTLCCDLHRLLCTKWTNAKAFSNQFRGHLDMSFIAHKGKTAGHIEMFILSFNLQQPKSCDFGKEWVDFV